MSTLFRQATRMGGLQKRSWQLLVVLFVVLFLSKDVIAKRVKGVIHTTSKNWIFLTRFCFLSSHGSFKYHVRYPVGYGTQDVLLYYDTPGQWNSVYNRGKTCEEMTSVLSITNNQIISLNTTKTLTSAHSGCELFSSKGDTWYSCTHTRGFKSSRERWWYFAFARCGQSKDSLPGLKAEYEIHMTNGESVWHKEFSADEFYILPVDIVFLMIHIVICIVSGAFAASLKKRHVLHSTYKIYMFALITWTGSLGVKVIAGSYYGITGWDKSSLNVTGRVSQRLSQVIFLLVLVLMAKGFTITRGYLLRSSMVKVLLFFCVYAATTVALFIWEGLYFDPGTVLYYYESPPGYCLVALQLIGWLWFAHAAISTLKHSPAKSLFYIPFFFVFTLWFWAGPLVILVAISSMARWSREKTVNGVEQLVAFVGHAVFLILTRPSAANKNFPYHVRASQLDTAIVLNDSQAKREKYRVESSTPVSNSNEDYPQTTSGLDVATKPQPHGARTRSDGLTVLDNVDSHNKVIQTNGTGTSSLQQRGVKTIRCQPFAPLGNETALSGDSRLPETAKGAWINPTQDDEV